MRFKITIEPSADQALSALEKSDPKKHKKVLKTLALMQASLKHPGLKTHEYSGISGPNGAKVFEAYVENKTPGAYRVFWCYGPEQREITILAITPHL